MRYINMILVCGLLLVANRANADPLSDDIKGLIQTGIKIQKMKDRQRRTEIFRQSEQERLRIERERLQRGGKPSAWFLVGMGANKKWKINDTFEHLAECKKHRAVDLMNTVCVTSDMLTSP